METIIRPMLTTDVDQVLKIDQLSFPNPWPQHSYLYEINENNNSRPWVLEIVDNGQNRIAGMAVLWVVLDEVHIGTFAIHPDYRNRGLGKLFLSEILEKAFNEGVIKAFLEVRLSNAAAIHLYQDLDFVIDGKRKEYYRDNNEDALLMSCEL